MALQRSMATSAPFSTGALVVPSSTRFATRNQKAIRSCRRSVIVPRADAFNNMINQLSEVVTNSPVNNLKKGIAKVQAGAYDEAATRAKVDAYLSDNAVSCKFVSVGCSLLYIGHSQCVNQTECTAARYFICTYAGCYVQLDPLSILHECQGIAG